MKLKEEAMQADIAWKFRKFFPILQSEVIYFKENNKNSWKKTQDKTDMQTLLSLEVTSKDVKICYMFTLNQLQGLLDKLANTVPIVYCILKNIEIKGNMREDENFKYHFQYVDAGFKAIYEENEETYGPYSLVGGTVSIEIIENQKDCTYHSRVDAVAALLCFLKERNIISDEQIEFAAKL